MARKRMIDPKIWDSDQVMSLSSDEFKVYIFLITQADDYGRLKVSYSLFCTYYFPLNQECGIPLMKNIIIKLSEIDLIEIYTVGRCEYIQHPNWDKYQKISHPSKPLIPSREECARILKKKMTLRNPPEVHSPPSKNHQSQDGPLETDQIDSERKKLISAEDIKKEKERQKRALKDRFPDEHKADGKELPPW